MFVGWLCQLFVEATDLVVVRLLLCFFREPVRSSAGPESREKGSTSRDIHLTHT